MFRNWATLKHFCLFVILCVFVTVSLLVNNKGINDIYKRESSGIGRFMRKNPLILANRNYYPVVESFEKIDWNDYEFMKNEAERVGLGEHGEPAVLSNPEDIELDKELFEIEGIHVLLSDKISVNRSLPDVRHEKCKTKLYLKHLPHVSVIVIFHNEHWSLMMRTLHGIYNRSPQELLNEIILVNDASTKEYGELENYVSDNFHGKVKVVKLSTRKGLIVARMEGAQVATSEVIVFLDAHIEVNVNWLPPLLEPIALNPKACTTPMVDQYDSTDFHYMNYGFFRGIFSWDFDYKYAHMRSEDNLRPSEPHPNPVMLGCAFAINRQYFWDLGAYDDELQIWNGENYELSFKLWLCGGDMLEVPCSRVAHVFRRHNTFRKLEGVDFVARNFKRVAEVWMDDYKYALYQTDPERFAKVDAGDLTKQKAIRAQLNCKPFEYFLKFVAPDILDNYPLPHSDDIAYGILRSEKYDNLCIDSGAGGEGLCGLYMCDKNERVTKTTQYFHVAANGDVFHDKLSTCFNIETLNSTSSQLRNFKYDLETHQIYEGEFCIKANLQNKTLTLEKCNNGEDTQQKFQIGYVNSTLIQSMNSILFST